MRKKKPEFRYETFRRPAKTGTIYVRFLDAEGRHVATRSTETKEKTAASAAIIRFLSELDLEAIADAKAARKEARELEDMTEIEKLGVKPFADFVRDFWADGSSYLQDHEEAGRPLSGSYTKTCRIYARLQVGEYGPFRTLSTREITFANIETFVRWVRKQGKSRYVIDRILDTIRRPLSWGHARGIAEKINFDGLVLPKTASRERGILDDDEVRALLAVPVQEVWTDLEKGERHLEAKPRPRLKGGERNEGPKPVDIRQKAAVLFALYLGHRRGEFRGIKWGAVDMENWFARVENNYTDADGDKNPKAGSFGIVPIAKDLQPIIRELYEVAKIFGRAGFDDYVLMNTEDPKKPIGTITIRRGWTRMLAAIGISEEERKARNLVLHGARHRFATVLIDSGELTPGEAQKFTRHKTEEMLKHYSDHIRPETLERARRALDHREGDESPPSGS